MIKCIVSMCEILKEQIENIFKNKTSPMKAIPKKAGSYSLSGKDSEALSDPAGRACPSVWFYRPITVSCLT